MGIPDSVLGPELAIGYVFLFIGLLLELGGTFKLPILGALFFSALITLGGFCFNLTFLKTRESSHKDETQYKLEQQAQLKVVEEKDPAN